MNALSHPRSTFEFKHGADCIVVFIKSRDAESVWKDVFAVTLNGNKVYFEMMRLKPRFPGQRPRNWGFGDITDPLSGERLWDFNTFARPLNFRGNMVTEQGDDDRTYVLCRNHAGVVEHRFLLAELLPQWRSFIPLPKLVQASSVSPSLPAAVVSVSESVPMPVPLPAREYASPPRTPPQTAHRPTLMPLVDRSPEMRQFVQEVLSRMGV